MTDRYKSTFRGNRTTVQIARINPPQKQPTGYRTCSNCETFYKNCKILNELGGTEQSMKNCCAWCKPIKEKK